MTEIRASVEVALPAEDAWAAVTDWARQGEWMVATTVTAETERRLSARTGLGPFGFTDAMELDVWDPPRRCEVRHLGRAVQGRGVFAVHPLGPSRSRVVWSELDPRLVAALGKPLAWALLKWSLVRFARWAPAR